MTDGQTPSDWLSRTGATRVRSEACGPPRSRWRPAPAGTRRARTRRPPHFSVVATGLPATSTPPRSRGGRRSRTGAASGRNITVTRATEACVSSPPPTIRPFAPGAARAPWTCTPPRRPPTARSHASCPARDRARSWSQEPRAPCGASRPPRWSEPYRASWLRVTTSGFCPG
jgi:hypothetical protein